MAKQCTPSQPLEALLHRFTTHHPGITAPLQRHLEHAHLLQKAAILVASEKLISSGRPENLICVLTLIKNFSAKHCSLGYLLELLLLNAKDRSCRRRSRRCRVALVRPGGSRRGRAASSSVAHNSGGVDHVRGQEVVFQRGEGARSGRPENCWAHVLEPQG